MGKGHAAKLVQPNEFEVADHYYDRVINSTLHPVVRFFLNMDNERIVKRVRVRKKTSKGTDSLTSPFFTVQYCHLNPTVDAEVLREQLAYVPRYFRWAGADLFHVTTESGFRKMVVIETNSCPSGQKSMPIANMDDDQNGYRVLMRDTFKDIVEASPFQDGMLAVVYDKNPMEASGYARTIADVFDEPVLYVTYHRTEEKPGIRWTEDGVMEVEHEGEWKRIRAAFRYVTQKPWNRFPLDAKTLVLNPVITCLAGGRNKLVASTAYELLNSELLESNLEIRMPETVRDVTRAEVPLWMDRFGGMAVIKVPYSNAGQGVYTITNKTELEEFMAEEFDYDCFIIQALIGNYHWSSRTQKGQLYHTGTVPDKRGRSYAADLRFMLNATSKGFRPLVMYGRRAAKPLIDRLEGAEDSWAILGTNLSFKNEDGSWGTDTSRLLLVDGRDFNQLGLSVDDLIDGYVQTVLSCIAIDKMAKRLIKEDGSFNLELFSSLNSDESLIAEIAVHTKDVESKRML